MFKLKKIYKSSADLMKNKILSECDIYKRKSLFNVTGITKEMNEK